MKQTQAFCAALLVAAPLALKARDEGPDARFHAVAATADAMLRVEGGGPSNTVYRLEVSPDLLGWRELSQLIPESGTFRFLDPAARDEPRRFYRFTAAEATPEDDWKNQVEFPADRFLAGGEGSGDAVRWVKFIILPGDPYRVHFQDSNVTVLHYDFARARFPQFRDLSRAEFDAVSLHLPNQQAILGSVLFPPRADLPEMAIQFAGQDPYSGEWVARYFGIVRAAIDAAAGVQALYFPAFEQTEAARAAELFLASRGIPLGSVRRWVQGDQVYSSGWALGRLRFIAASEIGPAYAGGRLRPGDILLTDGVPAEVPLVAGILSLVPATPNSHAALLAEAANLPFGYRAAAAAQARLLELDGHEIVLRCGLRYGYSEITVVDVEGLLDAATREELLACKLPPPVEILPKAHLGAYSAPVDALTPDDRRYFGGKAANYGILRRLVPDNSAPAIALSLDLWDEFMDQPLLGGLTLRQAVAEKLAPFSSYPPDIGAAQAALAAVRNLITSVAAFTPEQRAAVIEALAPFDSSRNIRFRSSSNAEDSKTFVGAGLYDSFSGCLLDDLDGDSSGPCLCDPEEARERGVFRAIQKVYASFYNDNAFLERLRRGIDEEEVGMAVLVHHSTPDEFELANGVAKLWRRAEPFGFAELAGTLVTQKGAVPVTNPEGNAQPEIVEASEFGMPFLTQRSSLVPLGASVLEWDADYTTLFGLMQSVYAEYSDQAGYVPPDGPLLDFEYKKVVPGALVLKQVRELPPGDPRTTDPFLVNEPATYWVFNHEQSDPIADHRLKCLLALETASARLAGANLDSCFYTGARFEYRIGETVSVLTGSPAAWPGARHAVEEDPWRGRLVRDSWTVGSGADRRDYVLTTSVPSVNAEEGLVVTPRELKKWLDVTYATPVPVPARTPEGEPTTTSTESVQLIVSPDLTALAPGLEETFEVGGMSVAVAFLEAPGAGEGPLPGVDPNFWGSFPAYYPAWAHATLAGLLPEPIALCGYYSTTGVLGHKGRYQWFIFEPALEPGLPDAQRQALAAANIQLIYIEREPFGDLATAVILGLDGTWRPM